MEVSHRLYRRLGNQDDFLSMRDLHAIAADTTILFKNFFFRLKPEVQLSNIHLHWQKVFPISACIFSFGFYQSSVSIFSQQVSLWSRPEVNIKIGLRTLIVWIISTAWMLEVTRMSKARSQQATAYRLFVQFAIVWQRETHSKQNVGKTGPGETRMLLTLLLHAVISVIKPVRPPVTFRSQAKTLGLCGDRIVNFRVGPNPNDYSNRKAKISTEGASLSTVTWNLGKKRIIIPLSISVSSFSPNSR